MNSFLAITRFCLRLTSHSSSRDSALPSSHAVRLAAPYPCPGACLARLRGRLMSASGHQGTPVDPPLSVDNRCGFGCFCGEFAAFHMIDVCVFARSYSTHACLSVPCAVCSLCRVDVDAMPAVEPHSPTLNRRLVDSLATPASGMPAHLR